LSDRFNEIIWQPFMSVYAALIPASWRFCRQRLGKSKLYRHLLGIAVIVTKLPPRFPTYYTDAPNYYTTESPDHYTTTYAAPVYYTVISNITLFRAIKLML
jgi:hypothetical protein